jgi:hypothetical protein
MNFYGKTKLYALRSSGDDFFFNKFDFPLTPENKCPILKFYKSTIKPATVSESSVKSELNTAGVIKQS